MFQESPSTDLYTLGRGILSIGEWSGTSPPAENTYDDVGVCNTLELELTEERLDHFSRRTSARVKDKIVYLESGYNLRFTLDEISVLNLKMFLKAHQSGSGILRANQALDKEFAIKFVSDNAEGLNQTWRFWRVKLSPAAALGLISDDWMGMQFSAEGLADIANHSTSPFFDATFATATTTSTTSTTSSTTTTAP